MQGGDDVERLVDATFDLPGAAYGYVTTSDRRETQHIIGHINMRLPGVFYKNVFGDPYLDFLGERLLSCNWARTDRGRNRLAGWLFNSLDEALEPATAAAREAAVKSCLGVHFFDGSTPMPQLAHG